MQNKGFIIGTAAFSRQGTYKPESKTVDLQHHFNPFESFLLVESSYGKVIVHAAYHIDPGHPVFLASRLFTIGHPGSTS